MRTAPFACPSPRPYRKKPCWISKTASSAANAKRRARTAASISRRRPQEFEIEAGAIVLATGFELTPTDAKKEYGAGQLPNVVSPLVVERLLAPTGPYGHVLRPSDGKEPDSIAYVQCAGSRDKTLGVEYCSRICCMYAIKQAMLLSGALPLADITIYYMDIRTFGKGYEQFYQNARAMGIEFVKGKVAQNQRRRRPQSRGARGADRRRLAGCRAPARPGRAFDGHGARLQPARDIRRAGCRR